MHRPEPDAKPLDSIALSLALWLGLTAGGLSLQRLAERAAADAQTARQASPSRAAIAPAQDFVAWGG